MHRGCKEMIGGLELAGVTLRYTCILMLIMLPAGREVF